MKRRISLPTCKSRLIRQLVSHYVQAGEVLPVADHEPTDVLVTHRALCTLRDAPSTDGAWVRVDVADCGAAYRFMMALLSVMPGHWLLTGTRHLLSRPIEELVSSLESAGGRMVRVEEGWHIEGRPVHAECMTIDCRRSSQFASALLLVAPALGLRTLHIQNTAGRRLPYVAMTLSYLPMLVHVPELPDEIPALGRPGDWSAAAFWYAMAMLHPDDEYVLLDLSLASEQGDSVIAEWLAPMGVMSAQTDEGVLVAAHHTILPCEAEFDVADHPDLVPVLASLACLLPADFSFLNVQNLQYKESDRLGELVRQLSPFTEIVVSATSLRVKGRSRALWPQPPYRFATRHDHRLAMAFSLFGKEAVLDDVECLRKSYPALISELL